MRANLRAVGAVILGSAVLGACATKGFVRTSVRDERAARIAADSGLSNMITTEVAGVRSEVTTDKNDVASLRNDLTALRTEFGAKITAMEEGLKFAFPVNFAFDDAAVREADKAALDRFAGVVNKYYSGSLITVEGFADPAGSTRYNMDLSKRRADAVAAYLGEKGLNTAGWSVEFFCASPVGSDITASTLLSNTVITSSSTTAPITVDGSYVGPLAARCSGASAGDARRCQQNERRQNERGDGGRAGVHLSI